MIQFDPSKLKIEFKDFIGIYENAFTKEECDEVIKIFERLHENGYSISREKLELDHKDSATSLDFVELSWSDDIIFSYHERFYKYLYPFYNNKYPVLQTLQEHKSSHTKIQKTLPTEGYHIWHCEHSSGFDMKNRLLTWILYLNDDFDGGETEFLYQSMRVKPKTGTFILFPAHFTHTHRGNPPLSGKKYISTGWIEYTGSPRSQGAFKLPDLTYAAQNKINYN